MLARLRAATTAGDAALVILHYYEKAGYEQAGAPEEYAEEVDREYG
jgi:hypothetical protein